MLRLVDLQLEENKNFFGLDSDVADISELILSHYSREAVIFPEHAVLSAAQRAPCAGQRLPHAAVRCGLRLHPGLPEDD